MTILHVLNRNFIDDRSSANTPISLSEYHLLRVRGNKAFDFLQGQLSCDIRQVNDRQGAHGLFCDLKGRIQHLVDVLFWSDDYYLLLPSDLSTDFLKQTRAVAMLSRIELSLASNYVLTGLLNTHDALAPLAIQYDAQQDCRYYRIFAGAVVEIREVKNDSVHAVPFSLRWQQALLQAKHFRLYPETQGMFLPHRLGLQEGGWIAFDKGCYRGQEIIARTHYRSSIKHELRSAQLHCGGTLSPGMELLSAETGQAIAEIVDCMPKVDDGSPEALISLKLDYKNECLVDSTGHAVEIVLK